jgi:diaminopropionate ammonia-lyase
MNTIEWVVRDRDKAKEGRADVSDFSLNKICFIKKFHESFKEYSKTPLASLDALSKELGVANIFVKDESERFSLNAFKVLGASYAIGRYIAEWRGISLEDFSYDVLKNADGERFTFVTATDGNHGRGVAWTANALGHKSVVYMPEGTVPIRLENIKKAGADAKILTGLNYDDCVRLAAKHAKEQGWVVVQDTAWEGYEKIPAWIMQGYGTMALEAMEEIQAKNIDKPTHVFVQSGVGSLPGAIQGFFTAMFGEERPVVAVLEPHKANCHYLSAKENKRTFVTGKMDTIMAGLACGEPNTISWEILKDYADVFISCDDEIAALGMRVLGNPLRSDKRVVSGESGAVTLGAVYAILKDNKYQSLKKALKIDETSKILLFSTEGDTDPESYRDIVWNGKYQS